MLRHGIGRKLLLGLTASVLLLALSGQSATAAVVPVHLDARRALVEVSPGVKFRAWTFNGTVPAPVIRATEGDTIQVTLTNSDVAPHQKCKKKKRRKKRKKCHKWNREQRAMPHSLDFHAARVAPNVDFRSVLPGDSYTFSFQADRPGVYMYHCGTGPVLEHIGMGMYGMIVVDPIGGRPPAKEVFLVQSELYGKVKKGKLRSSYKAMQTQRPKYVVFNGSRDRYTSNPITVGVNQPLRIYFVNAGPSRFSSFHVIGDMFDSFEHDGNPDEPIHNVSTQVIGPGGGGIFELSLPEAGTYPFVSHSAIDLDKGAVGLFKAG